MITCAHHIRDLVLEQCGVVPGPNDGGYGNGDGYGDGYGYGDGDGANGTNGTGNGYGYGYGDGYGYGGGDGDGTNGTGNGYGYGTGNGYGYGGGYGDGDGDGGGDGTSTHLPTDSEMLTPRDLIPEDHIPVVVTTRERAIFGYLDPRLHRVEGGVSYVSRLLRSRNAIRYGRVGGVEGLAETGPASGGTVSRASDRLYLTGVVSVLLCTPAATERWESMPAVTHE